MRGRREGKGGERHTGIVGKVKAERGRKEERGGKGEKAEGKNGMCGGGFYHLTTQNSFHVNCRAHLKP